MLLQFREFNPTIVRGKIAVYHRHDTIYDNIRGKIYSTALELVQMQISAPRPQKECRGVFHSIYGIICGHTMDIKIALVTSYKWMTLTGSGGCKLTYLKRHFQLKVNSCAFVILQH